MNGKMVDFINEYNITKRLKKLNYKTQFSISKRRKGKDTTMYRYLTHNSTMLGGLALIMRDKDIML